MEMQRENFDCIGYNIEKVKKIKEPLRPDVDKVLLQGGFKINEFAMRQLYYVKLRELTFDVNDVKISGETAFVNKKKRRKMIGRKSLNPTKVKISSIPFQG